MAEKNGVMEFNLDDWIYRAKIEKGRVEFEVISPNNQTCPNSLFKFYALSENSLNALENGYLYGSHPNQLNDLFDCHTKLIEIDQFEVILDFFGTEYSEAILREQFENNDEELLQRTSVNFREIMYRYFGIISLTSNPNNIQMWSYYNDHKGFLVEIDPEGLEFDYSGPFPINYRENPNTVKVSEFGTAAILYQSAIKDIHWQHEEEWRIIASSKEALESKGFKTLEKLDGIPREFHYSKDAIKTVALGNRFFTYDERKQISQKDLRINLDNTAKESYRLKKRVLDYLVQSNRKLLMALDRVPFKIEFAEFKIVDNEKDKYVLRME